MGLLKNRKFAVLICVVVVVLATLIGVRGSLNRLARDVEAVFYDSFEGIDLHLNNRLNSALGFASLMQKHPVLESEADALVLARRMLLDAKDIKDKFAANESMQRAYVELSDRAGGLELSQNEKGDIERYSSTFFGAYAAIQNSPYNQRAQSFMHDASFFAHLLKPFLFVKSPQLFA